MPRIALLVPAPDYAERWQPHAAQLTALIERETGAAVTLHNWRDDPAALAGYDLVLPLFAWGYQYDPARWFALLDWFEAEKLPVHNPPRLMRWNSDKIYLRALEAAGVPTIPTLWVEALADGDLAKAHAHFGAARLLVKPPVSAGSLGTYILGESEAIPADVAGRRMMVQPMLGAVQSEGEYSLFYFDGRFSHALLKTPKAGDFRVQEQFGARETPVVPKAGALALAEQTLAALVSINGLAAPPLYARIDMLRGADGALLLLELEAIEPSLFLNCAKDGGAAFAKAVAARL